MAHAGDQTPKFGPAAKAAKAAAAEQLRREKEFKIARDAEKRRKDEEKMATAARQRQADKDASKREQKAAEEARKLAETRERAAAAKRARRLVPHADSGTGRPHRWSRDAVRRCRLEMRARVSLLRIVAQSNAVGSPRGHAPS